VPGTWMVAVVLAGMVTSSVMPEALVVQAELMMPRTDEHFAATSLIPAPLRINGRMFMVLKPGLAPECRPEMRGSKAKARLPRATCFGSTQLQMRRKMPAAFGPRLSAGEFIPETLIDEGSRFVRTALVAR
jgi:hypothetical protein